MNMKTRVDAVVSRDDFVEFVKELRCNLAEHAEEWQNRTLDDFLEALSAWVQDMDGYYKNSGLPVPTVPTWKTLAEIVLAAKYYE